MNHFKHPDCNLTLVAPPDWDEQNPQTACDPLAVTRTYHQDGVKSHPVVISYWKPTDDELEMLVNGGCIALTVFGQTMQPVMLEVLK